MSDLKAVVFNCTLSKDEAKSHTRILLSAAEKILTDNGVSVDHIHVAGQEIAHGMSADMTKEGWARDDWPAIWPRVLAADIVILATPIWLGEESSYCRKVIERLYAMTSLTNEKGQQIYYNKVGGALVTGNEDGVKHVSMSIVWALQHMGFTIPPQADTGWIGPIGPGPSFGDKSESGQPVGFDNDFTKQSTAQLAWNLIHLARILKAAGGIPTQGNDTDAWKKGERFGYVDPAPLGA